MSHQQTVQFWQGYDLLQQGDYYDARKIFEHLPDIDDARHQLAYMYYCGLGGPQRIEDAIQLYRQLADCKGNIQAAYDLGMLLIAINRPSEAIYYLNTASSHANGAACYWLAQIYNGHNNPPVNQDLYVQYLQQAAQQKHYFPQRDLLTLKRDTATSLLQKTAYHTRLLILKTSVLPAAIFSKKWREKYF